LPDRRGLAGGLSRALASGQLLIHDRGRVLATWPVRWLMAGWSAISG
jgi:hypothetical protein